MRRATSLVLFCVLALAGSAPALAQPEPAEAAFREGRRLLDAGNTVQACEKFAESQALDPATGTLLNLADCHERLGKTASAWRAFQLAADQAARSGQNRRETEARRRMTLLEAKLVKLVVRADAPPAGFEVTRDGEDITDVLGAPVPVDPGEHTIIARAPDRQPWTTTMDVAGEGEIVTVEIPALERVVATTSPNLEPSTTGESPRGITPEPHADDAKHPGRKRRVLALAVGGTGIAFLGTGTVFGLGARSKWNDSRAHCDDENRCDPTGIGQVEDAQKSARVATVLFALGAAATATGVVLWLTAPAPHSRDEGVAVVPVAGDRELGVAISGRF